MLLRQRLTLILLPFLLPLFSVGQTQAAKQKLENYLFQLKGFQVDTFLVINSGCTGCEVEYADTSKAISNGQTIYILTKQQGQFKIVSFDDLGRQENYTIDTCSLFDTIVHNKPVLRQKDKFYMKKREELKKGKFLPPRPVHYSYEDVTIKISTFNYEFRLIENDSNHLEYQEEKEKWFVMTQTIVDRFFLLLKSVRG